MAQDKTVSDLVMATIKELCDETAKHVSGPVPMAGFARWDDIIAKAKAKVIDGSLSNEDVEWAINSLMDAGLLYEPTLGILKVI